MPPEPPRCIRCGYNLTGVPTRGEAMTCPECGARQTIQGAMAPRLLLWPGWVAVALGVAPSVILLSKAAADGLDRTIVAGVLLLLFAFAGPVISGLVALPLGFVASLFAPGRWRILEGAAHAGGWALGINLALLLVVWPLIIAAQSLGR